MRIRPRRYFHALLTVIAAALIFVPTAHSLDDGAVGCLLGEGGTCSASGNTYPIVVAIGSVNFAAEEVGGRCLRKSDDVAAGADCNTITVSQRVGFPLGSNGGSVDKLAVQHSSNAGWTAGDVIVLQMITVTLPGLAEADAGDPFYIKAAADGCGGASNCILAGTSGVWTVNATTSVSSGYFAIETDAASNDVEDDADYYLAVIGSYSTR